jgi:hypothetical protein
LSDSINSRIVSRPRNNARRSRIDAIVRDLTVEDVFVDFFTDFFANFCSDYRSCEGADEGTSGATRQCAGWPCDQAGPCTDLSADRGAGTYRCAAARSPGCEANSRANSLGDVSFFDAVRFAFRALHDDLHH